MLKRSHTLCLAGTCLSTIRLHSEIMLNQTKMSSCANLQLILQIRTVISLLGQTGFITRLLLFSN